MRWLYLLLLLLLTPLVSAEVFYYENTTTENVVSNTVNSSYVFENSLINETVLGNYTLQTNTIVVSSEDNTENYIIAGNGNIYNASHSQCLDNNRCILLEGASGGGSETITLEYANTVNTSGLSNPVFHFSFSDIDLESSEDLIVFFWNGVSYDMVFQYNGSNNALDNNTWTSSNFLTMNLSLNSYKMDAFKWFFQVDANNDLVGADVDGVFLDRILINQSGQVVQTTPPFYHKITTDKKLTDVNGEFYFMSSGSKNVTTFLELYDQNDVLLNSYNSVDSLNNWLNNVSIQFFNNNSIILENNYYLKSFHTFNATDGDSTSLLWSNSSFPSYYNLQFLIGNVSITNFTFSNVSFPYPISATVSSLNPVSTVGLYRDGVFVDNMLLCGPFKYCYVDSSVISETGEVSYSIVATDTIGINDSVNFNVSISPTRGVLLVPNFNNLFYASVGENVLYSVFVTTDNGNIVQDAQISINFTTLGDSFNLSYNSGTQTYDTTLNFNVVGDFPFFLDIGPTYYTIEPEVDLTGTTLVRTGSEVCFQIYTDRNFTDRYTNDLGNIWVVDKNDVHSLVRSLRLLDMWTNKNNAFKSNVFHTTYEDGEGCLTLYNTTAEYTYWFVDGTFTYADNYDIPNVLDYGGTQYELGTFSYEPNSTYSFYLTRYEFTLPRLLSNFVPLMIMLGIFVLSFAMFFVGGPMAGILSFVFFLVLYIFIEVGVWLFG